MRSKEILRPGSLDKPLLLATIFLLIIGFIMIFSASALQATEKYQHPFYFLWRQLSGAGLGLIFMVAIVSSRHSPHHKPLFVFGLLFLSLLLLALCLIMPPSAETNRWIVAFGLRFQPSELAKVSLILFLAYYLEKKKEELHEFTTLLPALAVVGLFALLIFLEPDLGTSFLVFFISFILLFLGGVRIRYLLGFLLLALALLIVFFMKLPQDDYRRQRWEAFLAPEEYRDRGGFHILQSKLAVGSGGLIGVGLGESTQKLYFLPCAHTDFIYAIIGEEFGLLGTLAVLGLYFLIFWRGFNIARRAPSLSHQLVAYGLTLAICSQALLNISVVLTLGPTKGAPLPFISYGRSALLCQLIGVGFLLNISKRKTLPGIKT